MAPSPSPSLLMALARARAVALPMVAASAVAFSKPTLHQQCRLVRRLGPGFLVVMPRTSSIVLGSSRESTSSPEQSLTILIRPQLATVRPLRVWKLKVCIGYHNAYVSESASTLGSVSDLLTWVGSAPNVLVILDKGTIFQSVKWSDQHVCNTTTWVLDRKCEFIAIHEESKDDIMHPD
jgi:hypothetical protein